ncbi:MAG: GNAT family N-acetyltransferase [Alphaproteobacteria bacterium]|nr:MAG: GNAT family N-acetyltransferase [Alphaproteobacteria bacterium]
MQPAVNRQPEMVRIIPYDAQYKQAFYDLNMAWLQAYFTVEPIHRTVLSDPEGNILAGGGEVFFALAGDRVVGTVAVRVEGGGAYELTKLGVDPAAQGGGIGRKLCETVIDWYRARPDGRRLFLETHSKLKPAMRLYEKLGFVLCANPGAGEYEGTDCYMEWRP